MRHGHETVKTRTAEPTGRHRRSPSFRGRHGPRRRKAKIAGLLVACAATAVVGVTLFTGLTLTGRPTSVAAAPAAEPDVDRSALPDEASRNKDRFVESPAPSASPSPSVSMPPRPVAGLNQAQMNNAALIVRIGKERQLPKRAYVIAVATALQESNLRNLASYSVPESTRYPHEGIAADHDSIGMFQQRAYGGVWGTTAQIMNPAYATGRFYGKLAQIPGWQSMSLSAAAQAVQVSAYPDAYAKHEGRAQQIVDSLTA